MLIRTTSPYGGHLTERATAHTRRAARNRVAPRPASPVSDHADDIDITALRANILRTAAILTGQPVTLPSTRQGRKRLLATLRAAIDTTRGQQW